MSVFLESDLDAEQILEFGADRVALAIGSDWRRDGVGRRHALPIEGWQTAAVLTPDDIMSGAQPTGRCLVYDDDHYYMGGVVAEKLARNGNDVTLVTPSYLASAWTDNTSERERIQARLIGLDVRIEANTGLAGLDGERVRLECVFTGRERDTEASTVVMVTARESREALYRELVDRIDVVRIGDCLAPGTIAACVRSGHEYAQEMDAKRDMPSRREIPLR